jgi:hypothetical protein
MLIAPGDAVIAEGHQSVAPLYVGGDGEHAGGVKGLKT